MVVHFFTFREKVNIAFSLFLKISPLCDVYIRFPLGSEAYTLVLSFSHYIHMYKVCIWWLRSLFSKFQRCSDKSFIRIVSDCHAHKTACEEFSSKQIKSLLSNSTHTIIVNTKH
eukprot:UN27238